MLRLGDTRLFVRMRDMNCSAARLEDAVSICEWLNCFCNKCWCEPHLPCPDDHWTCDSGISELSVKRHHLCFAVIRLHLVHVIEPPLGHLTFTSNSFETLHTILTACLRHSLALVTHVFSPALVTPPPAAPARDGPSICRSRAHCPRCRYDRRCTYAIPLSDMD